MAGLFFVVCSAIEELYRVGKVFIQSDGSFERCWQYVLETRQELFIKRYLDFLDNSDSEIGNRTFDNGLIISSRNQGGNCYWYGNTPDKNMAYQEIYEFTPSDEVDYAIIKVSLVPYCRFITIVTRYRVIISVI